MVVSQIKFVAQSQYQIRVKIELANEHKEFVSGKKNGKINKIMGQSNVQIMFDNFGEYNFNIDVLARNYESMKSGLSLVEQEMPASISFHVPDQYHKRIIGIGGQHIQRIMKKHSVFVKFSNAMDRGECLKGQYSIAPDFLLTCVSLGGMGREDDDNRVDNVICRTPAAQCAEPRAREERDSGNGRPSGEEPPPFDVLPCFHFPFKTHLLLMSPIGLGVYLADCQCRPTVPSSTPCPSARD